MAKVDPYCGKKSNVPNAARDKEMEDLRKEVKDLKRQLLQGGNMQLQGGNMQPRGFNQNRGGRGGHVANRGNRAGGGHGGSSVGDVTRSKLQETCVKFNNGDQCDGSCNLKHRCSQVIRPGHLCWRDHALVQHGAM